MARNTTRRLVAWETLEEGPTPSERSAIFWKSSPTSGCSHR